MPQPKVAAGTDFVRKSMEAFRPATVKATVLVDVLSYDASPALAVLEDAWINLGRACLYNPGLWVHKTSWGILAISMILKNDIMKTNTISSSPVFEDRLLSLSQD